MPLLACLQAAGGKAEALAAASANFMRQFRDADSRELKQLTAAQFMNIWEHYDDDGELRFICVLQQDVHQSPAVRLEGIWAKSKSAIPIVLHPLPAFLYRFIRPVAINKIQL